MPKPRGHYKIGVQCENCLHNYVVQCQIGEKYQIALKDRACSYCGLSGRWKLVSSANDMDETLYAERKRVTAFRKQRKEHWYSKQRSKAGKKSQGKDKQPQPEEEEEDDGLSFMGPPA